MCTLLEKLYHLNKKYIKCLTDNFVRAAILKATHTLTHINGSKIFCLYKIHSIFILTRVQTKYGNVKERKMIENFSILYFTKLYSHIPSFVCRHNKKKNYF